MPKRFTIVTATKSSVGKTCQNHLPISRVAPSAYRGIAPWSDVSGRAANFCVQRAAIVQSCPSTRASFLRRLHFLSCTSAAFASSRVGNSSNHNRAIGNAGSGLPRSETAIIWSGGTLRHRRLGFIRPLPDGNYNGQRVTLTRECRTPPKSNPCNSFRGLIGCGRRLGAGSEENHSDRSKCCGR